MPPLQYCDEQSLGTMQSAPFGDPAPRTHVLLTHIVDWQSESTVQDSPFAAFTPHTLVTPSSTLLSVAHDPTSQPLTSQAPKQCWPHVLASSPAAHGMLTQAPVSPHSELAAQLLVHTPSPHGPPSPQGVRV